MIGYFGYFNIGEKHILTILSFAFAIVIGGHSLFITGLKNLIRLDFDMRTLMTIAVTGAAIIGEWAEGAVVVVLFAISEVLEAYSMDKARNSIRSLMDLTPNKATIRRDNTEQEVAVEDIQIGDILIVKPGQKIAMDGMVITGESTVNQAAITGESQPVLKQIKDEVFAGTINEEGYLEIEVTKTVEDTTLAKIIHLVEEAQAERAPSQAFVDKFAKYYTPAIIAVAFFVAIVPPLLFGQPWYEWVYQGLAVLVVGCPCALVVSTPVAIVTAIGTAAKQGVLIKGGVYLEEMANINAIAFDKTGTITKGSPEVTDVEWFTNEEEKHKEFIYTLEENSLHPLAKAIQAYTKEYASGKVKIEEFQSVTGKGIKGKIKDILYWIGNEKLASELLRHSLEKHVSEAIHRLQKEGKTVMIYGNEDQVLAIIAVRDEPRKESKEVISQLHHLGINETIMLTGDNQETAQAIGKEVGLKNVKANLLPEEKLQVMKQYKELGKSVAMVGDGVNDAPALATATIGIAMGGAGTDTALETADLALMGDDLTKLPFTRRLSKKTLKIIKQNISFSIIVKLFALMLVVPGWLTLWIAIFADMGATLIVTANGLRLLKVK